MTAALSPATRSPLPVSRLVQLTSSPCRSCQTPDRSLTTSVPLVDAGARCGCVAAHFDPDRAALTMSSVPAPGDNSFEWEKHMRKTMTRMGLGLALVVGAAGAVAAQSTRPGNRPDTTQSERGER